MPVYVDQHLNTSRLPLTDYPKRKKKFKEKVRIVQEWGYKKSAFFEIRNKIPTTQNLHSR